MVTIWHVVNTPTVAVDTYKVGSFRTTNLTMLLVSEQSVWPLQCAVLSSEPQQWNCGHPKVCGLPKLCELPSTEVQQCAEVVLLLRSPHGGCLTVIPPPPASQEPPVPTVVVYQSVLLLQLLRSPHQSVLLQLFWNPQPPWWVSTSQSFSCSFKGPPSPHIGCWPVTPLPPPPPHFSRSWKVSCPFNVPTAFPFQCLATCIHSSWYQPVIGWTSLI